MAVTSTMMDDYQLTLLPVYRYGRQVHAASKVITFTGDGYVESTFAEVAERADRTVWLKDGQVEQVVDNRQAPAGARS